MHGLEVQVVGIEHVEPVREKRCREGLSDELEAIAEDVAIRPDFIRYSTFHTWSGSPS
jgi:hypothetical protein